MKKAVDYFNSYADGYVKKLSVRRLEREPSRSIGTYGARVEYAVIERDGQVALAWYFSHRMTNDGYKEIGADGSVLFSWASSTSFFPPIPQRPSTTTFTRLRASRAPYPPGFPAPWIS